MRTDRRQFVKGSLLAAVFAAVPTTTTVATPSGQWDEAQAKLNTFSGDDTPEIRLNKFNQLTGLSLTLGSHWLTKDRLHRGGDFGERCLMDGSKHYTGPMNEETFMNWTAQVALGYRLAKVQG